MTPDLTAKVLSELDPRHWTVRHDVTIAPNVNVKYLVVGPPGVFAIDSRFRAGEVFVDRAAVWVNGQATDMVDQAVTAAQLVYGKLRSWVTPVLAVDGDVRGEDDPEGLVVVTIDRLFRFLQSESPRLPKHAVERIGRLIADDHTWNI